MGFEDYRRITIKEMGIWGRIVWTGQAETFDVSQTEDVDILQLRIRSSMITKWVMNSLTPTGWRKLNLKSKHFTYHFGDGKDSALDGPTMLLVLLKAANPSTRVGLSAFKSKLSRASVTNYDDDVTKLIDVMEANYQEILTNHGTHDDYAMNLFDALMDHQDSEFRSHILTKKNEWEAGEEIDSEGLIDHAILK